MAVFSVVLLVGMVILFISGLASYAAYNPDLRGNDPTAGETFLDFYAIGWTTEPYWIYRLNQGIHVILGIVLIPVVLAKLWSVLPKLFAWPPARSLAHLAERLTLALLISSVIFVFATGIVNIQYWYVFPGSFYRLHYWASWVFIAAFIAHTAIKFGHLISGLRGRSFRVELRTSTAETRPEPSDEQGLVAPHPEPATMSRRGALGLVGGSSLALFMVTAGQSIGGPFRYTALLAPHGQVLGDGPNDFQILSTAQSVGLGDEELGSSWRLELIGPAGTMRFSRDELLGLPQHQAELPIACVEGWSTANQRWSGVRLAELARLVGAYDAASVYVESVQRGGIFAACSLRGNQIRDPLSLLALGVNGVALSRDHGYPARTIVPANPGVHNTKWVGRMTFEAP